MMEKNKIKDEMKAALAKGQTALTEARAKEIFKAAGMPVVKEIQAADPAAAARAAEKIGFPVVLKGLGATLLHKSEAELVHLALPDPEQVKASAREMATKAGDALEGFLVQPMVRGRRELVAGMFRDPQFGAVIMFGLGGVLTEALGDIVFKIAPLNDADITDMAKTLACRKLLGAFRGEAACDLSAVKSILTGLSDLAAAFPMIREIDINPLIIGHNGAVLAVDGLIVLDQPKAVPPPKPRMDMRTLNACFYPESIAFVGASASPGKWGHMLATNAMSRDTDKKMFLVNPKGGTIMGRPVFESVTKVPSDIDLAVVTVPAIKVMDLIPELAKKNTKGMLLVTSGFKEVGPEGETLEKAVSEAARQAGILMLGPNTMGICNPHANFYCSAAHAYPLPGSTALVCQSGNMGTQLLAFAEQQGIGIRAFSGSGNEAMVTIEDYMEAFEVDDLTRTVVLYIESVKDGKRFFESARRVSGEKPVVVLKGGRTRIGGQAAASHTGAMASDTRVFDAACRQAGIIQVRQPMELLDLSAVFSSLPLPRGNRVAIMTLGGGWGVIATDLCAEYGLEVPPLSTDIVERLNGILPEFWSHANPVDLVGETDPEIPKTSLEALLAWDGCDAVIHLGIDGKRVLMDNMVQSICRTDPGFTQEMGETFSRAVKGFEEDYTRYVAAMVQKYEKPVLGVSLLTDASSRTLYRFEGQAYKSVFFPSPERAVKALSGMWQYRHWRDTQTRKI